MTLRVEEIYKPTVRHSMGRTENVNELKLGIIFDELEMVKYGALIAQLPKPDVGCGVWLSFSPYT